MMKKINHNIVFGTVACIALLTTRILITGSLMYVFLVWNLLLAYLPYAISIYTIRAKNMKTLPYFFSIGLWLILFPNSPYIITDFIHLKNIENNIVWLDIAIISVFSFTGLYMGIMSLHMVVKSIKKRFSQKIMYAFTYSSIVLAGFGIYLGRVLRWNSWDIIHKPISILKDIINIIIHPSENIQAYLITFTFSAIIFLGYKLTKPHNSIESL